MKIRKAVFCLGFALLISLSQSASADLDTVINRAILKATEHDTSRTDKQKLFENRCETITRYLGFANDPTGRARKYSCDELGVGIALYAGADLGKHSPEKVGQYFVDALAKEGVKAEVFIKPGHEHGSSMAFYINGESWMAEPARPSDALKKIEFLANETKLILYTSKRADSSIFGVTKE